MLSFDITCSLNCIEVMANVRVLYAATTTSTTKLFSCRQHKHNDNKLRAQNKMHISISKMPISYPNLMFDHLLESSHRDNSNKCSNIEFGQEKTQ